MLRQVEALLEACEPTPPVEIPETAQAPLSAFVQSLQAAQNENTAEAWLQAASLGGELLALEELKTVPLYAQVQQQIAQCWRQAGSLWGKQGKTAEALEAYEDAIRYEPENPWHYNAIASLYDDQKEFVLALEWYAKALAIDPDEYRLWSNRGLTHYHAQNYQAAVEDFSAAIDRNPERARYYAHRGLCLARSGRMDQAWQDFERALALEVDNNVFMDIGAAHLLAGNLPEAFKNLRQAFELDPQDTLESLASDPDLDTIRTSPEFQSLLEEFTPAGS